ncbi:MAG: LysM domain-containing protein [Desulfovermiculus sp.]|nr:LysM domain-containing protein [Desulfovermiculus sp.]
MSRNKWIDDLDDLEAPSEKEPRSFSLADWFSNLGQTPYLPWIAAGVAGVLLVFGLTLFLSGEDEESAPPPSSSASTPSSSPDLETVIARLDSLENKVSRLASQMDERGPGQPEHDQGQTLEALGMQLQNLDNDFTRFKKQANSNFSALQSKIAAQSSASSSGSGTSTSSDQETESTYTVKKGDNLYQIGLKFDVSVDQLRSWNDLSPSSEIYPGQKIKVKP